MVEWQWTKWQVIILAIVPLASSNSSFSYSIYPRGFILSRDFRNHVSCVLKVVHSWLSVAYIKRLSINKTCFKRSWYMSVLVEQIYTRKFWRMADTEIAKQITQNKTTKKPIMICKQTLHRKLNTSEQHESPK